MWKWVLKTLEYMTKRTQTDIGKEARTTKLASVVKSEKSRLANSMAYTAR
jgi:hypothetical protein